MSLLVFLWGYQGIWHLFSFNWNCLLLLLTSQLTLSFLPFFSLIFSFFSFSFSSFFSSFISYFIYLLKPICLITVLLIIFVSLRKISFKLITPNSEFSCSMFGKLSRSYKCEKKFKQTVIKISTLLLFFFFFLNKN